MNIDISQFLNPYDIIFIFISIISIFFGIKNGAIKSLFNLFKWIIIFYLIKNYFDILRPIVDPYAINQTVSDILIFFIILISSYILISFFNRLLIGLLQPKRLGFIDMGFGIFLGIVRGYIIFVLIIFMLNNSFSRNSLPEFLSKGNFSDIVNFGTKLLDNIPREINKINNLDL